MRIDYDLIIGNIILSMNKQIILKEDIYQCLELFDNLTSNNYYLIGNSNVDDFLEYYNFLFCNLDENINIKCDDNILERYFRVGISKKIIEFCDIAVSKLKDDKKVLVKKNNLILKGVK